MGHYTSYFDWEKSLKKKKIPYSDVSQIEASRKEFKHILNRLIVKQELYKSVAISNKAFTPIKNDMVRGVLDYQLFITNEEEYRIVIDVNNKTKPVFHKCDVSRMITDLKIPICPHLIKLFLMLEQLDVDKTLSLLKRIYFP